MIRRGGIIDVQDLQMSNTELHALVDVGATLTRFRCDPLGVRQAFQSAANLITRPLLPDASTRYGRRTDRLCDNPFQSFAYAHDLRHVAPPFPSPMLCPEGRMVVRGTASCTQRSTSGRRWATDTVRQMTVCGSPRPREAAGRPARPR